MGDAAASPTSTLICREDATDFVADADDGDDGDGGGGGGADSVVVDDRLLVVDPDEEYLALLLSKESASVGGGGDGDPAEEMEEWVKAARSGCVRWIIKTTAAFRFSGKTAYVAVTYLDRFLAQRRVNNGQEWALQLLAVACVSLATKLEEQRAPRLSEFRLDAHEFDAASIQRMELFVLSTLGWRMAAPTPFPFLSCFAARFRHEDRRPILLRAVRCVFAAIKEMSSVEYQPSTIAVASILVARGGREGTRTPGGGDLDALKAILGSSCPQLDTGHVYSCYSAMMVQEDDDDDDKSPTRSSSTLAAASGVSCVAAAGASPVSVGPTNNAAAASGSGTTAPPATPDNQRNKRRRLRSPQRH